jgi:tetratricopeptide (TPR) repeat protein
MESELSENHPERADIVLEYQIKAYQELADVCQRAVSVISNHLLPAAPSPSSQAFFTKLQGDFTRYLAECASSDQTQFLLEQVKGYYDKSLEVCTANLDLRDPIRLGLVLNMSVFAYEHLGEKERATELLELALSEIGETSLDELAPPERNESIAALAVMRRNLLLWSGGIEDEQPE